PQEIILPVQIDTSHLVKAVSKTQGKRIKFLFPKKGKKKNLLELANKNAAHSYLLSKLVGKPRTEIASELLIQAKDTFNLPVVPYRIECFDISNLSGKEAVASMVVFEDTLPKKKDYRRFKLKSEGKPNDCLMMREVIERRLVNLNKKDDKFGKRPDLILVDGGKPQLSAVENALKKSGINDIPVVALAKKVELFYKSGFKKPISLRKNRLLLNFFRQIRDESHRFALAYHQKIRSLKMTLSLLDQVKGIGYIRKEKLFKKFGSLESISKANIEELKKVIPEKIAIEIKRNLNKK
ncbi:MAG: excinuclease ABC subunit C, partial [Actinomycetia bacterium]|nr:excinuclease ABC subunit C [Actinomycetes bacterium]